MSDIVERLMDACNGHPHAKIPWPYRVLHDAADEITRLREQLEKAKRARDTYQTRLLQERAHADALAGALEDFLEGDYGNDSGAMSEWIEETRGDLRRALTAYRKHKEPGE